MIITNEKSIYIFFEVIKQLEPKSILDVGMFLKRIGNLSRYAMDCKVPEETILDGVDFFEEYDLPIWRKVYNDVQKYEFFFENIIGKQYDLIILLGTEELLEKVSAGKIVQRLLECAQYALVDEYFLKQLPETGKWKFRELKFEECVYYLIFLN